MTELAAGLLPVAAAQGAQRSHGRGPSDECAVIGKFQGDTATFRQSLADRAGEFTKYGDTAQAAGGIHHRSGLSRSALSSAH